MLELNEASFAQETSQGVVVVDFYAPWCGPCRVLSPILEKLESEGLPAKIVKVNIDDAQTLAREKNISAVPTILFMKDGEVVGRSIGLVDEASIKRKVSELS